MTQNSIDTIRTQPQIIERENWLTGYKWLCVATPHRKTDISQLTMGNYQNYCHDEYTFAIYDDSIRINRVTRHNENAVTNDLSSPYKPENYPAGIIPLFNELIELTRKNKHRTP